VRVIVLAASVLQDQLTLPGIGLRTGLRSEAPHSFLYLQIPMSATQYWDAHSPGAHCRREAKTSGKTGRVDPEKDLHFCLVSKKRTLRYQLGLFAETSQPPDTGVVEPPVSEELQGINLAGVNETFCHLSSGPKYSPRAGVVFPVSAGG